MRTHYALTAENRRKAIEQKLFDANWYLSPVPREQMLAVMERKDFPAIRDTLIWFGLIGVSGYLGYYLWGSWLAIIPFVVYGVLYTSCSDSRWHETLHGTAFKTNWMNNVVYEIAAFMVCRESTPWRWSHMRHHSDTYIKGVDPEVTLTRPPSRWDLIALMTNLKHIPKEFKKMLLHAMGQIMPGEETYVPESQYRRMFFIARIYLSIYVVIIGAAIYAGSWLPLMYVGLPSFYGQWLLPIYGLPQHAVLAEDTLDHRLNSRTVYMNRLNRFLYWEMNYHIEHHMYPMVPYYQLHKLHALIKDDLPPSYSGLIEVYKEIIPALRRQMDDPNYFVDRSSLLPVARSPVETVITVGGHHSLDEQGWVEICACDQLSKPSVARFDYGQHTFAIYRTEQDHFYATEGVCTHGQTHLAGGMLNGHLIECPKHNGRFDITDGSPQRPPVCVALKTYQVKQVDNQLYLNLSKLESQHHNTSNLFEVISNENVASYIKELILKPLDCAARLKFTPGDYLQFEIPKHHLKFDQFEILPPYFKIWHDQSLLDLHSVNNARTLRNYSIASNPDTENHLRFNVRIQMPPSGKDCNAGVGSSYIFSLKSGDQVRTSLPMGSFHPKCSNAEMIYLGGGVGMSPLRSHLSYLFESLNTQRKVSFWYGARAVQELFYQDYFEDLVSRHKNFSYYVALSDPLSQDNWPSYRGFIHDVLWHEYLREHPCPAEVEYYLCGPPPMLNAARLMLKKTGVPEKQISFDAF